MMFAWLSALSLSASAAPQLPPYDLSIRCAGLAEAASALPEYRHQERELFELGVFWGMAASERARKDGRTAPDFTQDQVLAKAKAARDLGINNDAWQALQTCKADMQAFTRQK